MEYNWQYKRKDWIVFNSRFYVFPCKGIIKSIKNDQEMIVFNLQSEMHEIIPQRTILRKLNDEEIMLIKLES